MVSNTDRNVQAIVHKNDAENQGFANNINATLSAHQ